MSERRKVLELFYKHREYIDERVNAGIELYRKGYAVITVKDENGQIIPDAKVKIFLTASASLIASAIDSNSR